MESIIENTTKEQFEETLSNICDSYQVLNSDERYKYTDEYLYGIILNKDKENERKFVIFSSISIYDNHFRERGSDAIRILRWKDRKPVGTHIRVNRTKNWYKNLKKKVLNFDNSFEDSIKRTITVK